MKDRITSLLTLAVFALIAATVAINYSKELAVDRTKIPEKIELDSGFQRWITNLKNSEIDINADDFRLKEENEVYNSASMKIYSSYDEKEAGKLNEYIQKYTREFIEKGIRDVATSPNKKQILDIRNIEREGYMPNEIHYYGYRDERIIDSKILTCNPLANCIFDRGFFFDNDVFIISEISRNIEKDDENIKPCTIEEICTYTIKLHVIDLMHNSRLVYESPPFNLNLKKTIPEI